MAVAMVAPFFAEKKIISCRSAYCQRISLAHVFQYFSLCRLPMNLVPLDYLASWIDNQRINNIQEYKNLLSWKKN